MAITAGTLAAVALVITAVAAASLVFPPVAGVVAGVLAFLGIGTVFPVIVGAGASGAVLSIFTGLFAYDAVEAKAERERF